MMNHEEIDRELLDDIQAAINAVAPDMADYLLIKEVSRITHLTTNRIWYNITTAKTIHLSGFKRGDRWFVHKLDALRWAEQVSRNQETRWANNAKRIAKIIRRASDPSRATADARSPLPPVPEGVRVYTYDEAAATLGVKLSTITSYVQHDDRLGHARRYRNADGVLVIDADAVDAYRQAVVALPDGRGRWPSVPEGLRVYTYNEAMQVLRVTLSTLQTFLVPGNRLGEARRFRDAHGRIVIEADAVDAYHTGQPRFETPPPGMPVYTYAEAARALGVANGTLYAYLGPGGVLAHLRRFRGADGVRVLEAPAVDAYMADRAAAAKQTGGGGEIRAVGPPRWPPVPDGVRVYTYLEAAEVLRTTRDTIMTYVSPRAPLGHVRRFTNGDGRIVLEADPIDAYLRDHRLPAGSGRRGRRANGGLHDGDRSIQSVGLKAGEDEPVAAIGGSR